MKRVIWVMKFFDRLFLSRMMRFAIKLQFTTVVVVTARCTQTAATAMKYAPPLRSTIDRHLEHHLLISHLATLGHLSVWGVWPGSTGHASTHIGSLHRAPLVQFLSNLNIIFSRFIAWDHQQRVRWSRCNCQSEKKQRIAADRPAMIQHRNLSSLDSPWPKLYRTEI